jgi:hypothetical protein
MLPAIVESGGSWNLGLKNWIEKKLNPDAHTVSLVESAEKAYFDEKRKVWVFPGDDPDELVKSVGPPPKTPMASNPEPAPEPDAPKDPLAAMMAPPARRAPASLKRPGTAGGLSTPRGYPGMLSPGMLSPAAAGAPPQFVVFQPKTATK